MNQKEISDTLENLQNMCINTLVLYEAHVKNYNQELTDLANATYYILWNLTKSMIALNHLQNSALRYEQDFAIAEICVIINECTKKIIGFTKSGRGKSFWIDKMGNLITRHPELKNRYDSIKESWISFADDGSIQDEIKNIRNIATHGDDKIKKIIELHQKPISDVVNYLDLWKRNMLPTASFTFTYFENECYRKMK